jgi:hypothetical protein
LKAGSNKLEIQVTNEWTNRLAGDRLLPATKVLSQPATPAGGGFGAPPVPAESGLLGEVVLLEE